MVSRLTSLILIGLATAALGVSRATAQWVDGGLPVCVTPGGKSGVSVAPDGLGGAFLTWTAHSPGDWDIFAQHVRSDGSLDPLWPIEGLSICSAVGLRYVGAIVSDGSGGAFIAWNDYRSPPPDSARLYAVYLQRITSDGRLASGWPENGLAVCPGGCTAQSPKLAPDGTGGVFLAWSTDTMITPSYFGPGGYRASRVTAEGMLAPGWPLEGIPIANASSRRGLRSILTDGSGGFYAIADGDIDRTYCHRITSDGAPATGWSSEGREVSPTHSSGLSAVPDGEGGLFLFWSTLFAPEGGSYKGVYATRLGPDGSPAAGWAEASVRASPQEASAPLTSVVTSDGGAIVLWVRFGFNIVSAHAQKVTSTGSIAAGWPEGGFELAQGARYLQNLVGASDGMGGAYFAWEFYESAPLGVPPPTGVIAQHLTDDGVPALGWPSEGVSVSSAPQSNEPAMIPVSGNAAIVAWESYSGGPGNKVYAQKLIASGMVSFALLLTRADASPNRVRLAWRASPPTDVPVTIYRREEGGSWQAQGVARPDFTGVLTFEDPNVSAERDYSYRLSIWTGGEEHSYGETAVRVPAFALALRLASPNPVRGDLSADIELPNSAAAWIELIDVRGRIVERKQVGGSGPAILRVPIAVGKRVPSGVYFLRVTQGGNAVTRRAVLIR